MDRQKSQTTESPALGDLARIRNSLLIFAQSGETAGLGPALDILSRIKSEATASEMATIAALCGECEEAIGAISSGYATDASAHRPLDIITQIEAAVWAQSGYVPENISDFVESSFEELIPRSHDIQADPPDEEFEIDEETLEVFRCEAEEILEAIDNNLRSLVKAPGNQHALWDIRRNAHTFKGSAGIVGYCEASEIAHRMEDLLDQMVEQCREATPEVIAYLQAATERLRSIVAARNFSDGADALNEHFEAAVIHLSLPPESKAQSNETSAITAPLRPEPKMTPASPIVRVALDRLDDVIKVSRALLINRAAIVERFEDAKSGIEAESESIAKFESLLATQRNLIDEIQAKLLQIRMVRFGTLETRLNRAVNVTCLDAGKKAVVDIENGDVEIDTQVIDALIEPLLHLLKNAVVHGIESPDTRRLIGKAERGSIKIGLEADAEALILSVSDDGGGISPVRLKEKAVARGLLSPEQSAAISDREAIQLIFEPGLTTSEKVDLNAGRGVGMSIVKECVESRGGTILIDSELQRGTTFTILMPVSQPLHAPAPSEPVPEPESNAGSVPLVLVVDDSASIRRHTTMLIEAQGLRAITANNGAEALELLLSGQWEPHLILSDVEMPQIDGWNLLEYIKTDDNFGHIPVVMISSLAANEHRQRALELGAADYVVKPFGGIDLARILETCGILTAA